MRITFVAPPPDLSGGIRVIAIYAERLQRRGHSVLIVHPPNAQPTVIRRVKNAVRGRGWKRVPRVYPSHFDSLSVPRRVLEQWRPVDARDVPDADVVVATWWETAEWVNALPASKGAKAYFIQHYEVHEGQPIERVKRTWTFPMTKIAVAQWLADLARSEFGDPGAIVVPNSVDLDQFNAPPRDKQAVPTIGFIYAEHRWKGADLAVEGIRLAQATVPQLRGVSFGMARPTDALPLPPNTDFRYLPQQHELRAQYARCDAWIVASRSEGFGLPLLEAMACRTPVVATPTGAAPELLARGGGILVDHEHARGIADAILQIARMTPSEWRVMSDAAHATAHAYTWDDATDRFEQALLRARQLSAAAAASPTPATELGARTV